MATWHDYERQWLIPKKDKHTGRDDFRLYIVFAQGPRMDTIFVFDRGPASYLTQEKRGSEDTINSYEAYQPKAEDYRKAVEAVFGEWMKR
jgi:hypothetical protein